MVTNLQNFSFWTVVQIHEIIVYMLDFTLAEAQLFRLLAGFFGKERVVPRMSVLAACGGELPAELPQLGIDSGQWARSNTCLFTIVDEDDNPKLVVEFFSGFADSVDVTEVEHQRYLMPILEAAGVLYITFSDDEFAEITDPRSSLDFFSLLQAKVGDELSYRS